MGQVIVKIKVMPASSETDMQLLKEKIKTIIEKEGALGLQIEIEPIAFGLKALILLFSWPEEKILEELEEKIQNLKETNSATILDMRRAIG